MSAQTNSAGGGTAGKSGTGVGSGKPSRPQRGDPSRRVLDEATRQRRARKALESLEQDNFHDDPHADLVMSKKALNLFQEEDDDAEARKASRKKGKSKDYYRQR